MADLNKIDWNADMEKPEKLTLRHNFRHNRTGQPRTNVLKAYMNRDELQIYVDNGKRSDGVDVYAAIRLNEYQMKVMIEFLQRQLKC